MKHLRLFFGILKSIIAAILLLTASSLAQAPANDSCGGATIVTSLPFSVAQNTRLATPGPSDPALTCAQDPTPGSDGKTVWFQYIADSTRFVDFTTEGSQPSDYDIAMGIFTGSCGSLVMDTCNDDVIQGVVRASAIRMLVHAGTVYTILVGEWNGGGPSGGTPTGGDLLFRICADSCPLPPIPVFRGPKSGSVAGGVIVNTSSFGMTPLSAGPVREAKEAAENEQPPLIPAPPDVMPPKGPPGSNYMEDKGPSRVLTSTSQPVVLTNFLGIPNPGQGIPPDPISAVGPNNIVSLVNSTFRIFDKSGTVLKTINAAAWFNSAFNGAGPFDPQVVYDHFANRWVMVWDNVSSATAAQLFISVSDDDNPIGTWYNWAIPANALGDSLTANFSDYPGLGIDDSALYICSNEFGITAGGFQYTKVRIVPKAQLYANTAGPITWTDFWDLREPDHPTISIFGVRAAITFGTPGAEFLLNAAPYFPGTFFTLWKITNPVSAPSISAVNIPVVSYQPAGNADQLGGSLSGGTPYLIETGGSGLHFQPVYRDSSLWVSHAIASGTGNNYSAVRYIRFNPFANTNLEDVAMGLDGYWYYYCSLMANQNDDIIITFGRSSATEYAGAYLAGKRGADPPGLSPSVPLKVGEGNYVVVGGGRNRWGDYYGIGLDPSDQNSIWAFGEYVAAPSNNFSTWEGQVKMAPVAGKYAYALTSKLDFGPHEKGTISDTLSLALVNYGLDTLTITGLTLPDSNFQLANPPATPVRLSSFASVTVHVIFTPKVVGPLSTSVNVASDDTPRSPITIALNGSGFQIDKALSGVLYAGAGDVDSGKIFTVSGLTGAATLVGKSGYSSIVGLRIRPGTHELVGLAPQGVNHLLVRINSTAGDAHPVSTIPVSLLKGMTFVGDSLYVGRLSGSIYKVDFSSGTATLVANTGLSFGGLATNPFTGQIWASGHILSGGPVDRIYKITLPSGTPTIVGSTGLGSQVNDIAFDANGNLFGTIGTFSANSLVLIDTTSGAAKVIGSMGVSQINGLAADSATAFPTESFKFAMNWNLFSLPLAGSPKATLSLFPSAVSSAFAFQDGYVTRDSIGSGEGFWLKFAGATGYTVLAVPLTNDTIPVRKKWNLIGSLSVPVPVASVVTEPPSIVTSSFLSYDNTGGGYVIADSIQPSKGYWVKADSAGSVILAGAATLPKGTAAHRELAALRTMNTLTIRDALGRSQTLYYGKETDEKLDLRRFEMPPAPPEGAFDARFAGNTLAILHSDDLNKAVDFPLLIQSPECPLQVSWRIVGEQALRYSLVAAGSKSPAVLAVLKGDGQISIGRENAGNLHLRAERNLLPTQFALRQNYPNPFNPTTKIQYELPSAEYVTLVVYDILGKEVTRLVDGREEAGYYGVQFNGENYASGIYFYRLTAGKFVSVQKMMLVK